ncbi:MAG: hydroxymethylglutaryl-CoA lyase [Bacteroidia bacterium]
MEKVEWVECPRDAMQGLHWFIPTQQKIRYINTLLNVGFDVLDFGSFVSPKAIPQLQDTAEVLAGLNLSASQTRLLAIIANLRGGEAAAEFDEISYLGFPFSISETFQQRNTNSSISQSLSTVEALQNLCLKSNKELVVYISMAFGNPYGDEWNADVALRWTEKIAGLGIKTIALADTVGLAKAEDVKSIFEALIPSIKDVRFGAHLHAGPSNWKSKVEAAWDAGCRRFDTALKGYGGCPMAEDELVGNLAAENFKLFLDEKQVKTGIDSRGFERALLEANTVFAEPLAT